MATSTPKSRSLVTADELQRLVSGAQFAQPFGFEVRSCDYGLCELAVPFRPQLERPGGVVNGIAIMAAADVAMWLAIMTRRPDSEQWVTTDLKTAFLRGVRKEEFVCTARVLKLGRRTAYGTADCVGAKSGLVAHHVVTYTHVQEVSVVE
jgi:uncharacterized protein (TIGR00369 family)